MVDRLTTTFHLMVEPQWSGDRLAGVKVTGVTQNRPRPRRGAAVVRLSLTVPASLFRPLVLDAVVVVPDDDPEADPVSLLAIGD